MVFLKHFDTSKQTLHGIGKCYAQRNAKISDLVPTINERMRWATGTPLKLYEEIKPGMIELMKPKLTFSQSEIQDGDVICFQVDLSEKEYARHTALADSCLILARVHDLEIQGLYSNPIQFYDFLQNRVLIVFRPKFDSDHDAPEFNLVLSKKQTYDTVKVSGYPTRGCMGSSA
jgi:ubiquitin carboxyl-terminal hydrolase 7